MKISRLVFVLSTVCATALPAVSFAGLSANLPISGTVAANNDIEVTPNGTSNTSINITGGNTGLDVASAQETSNDSNGYTITVVSANNGQLLLGGTSNTEKTAYQLSYDGGTYISPTTGSQTIKSVSSLTGLTVHDSPILVTVTAYPNAVAGTYSDTLTFAIVAN